MDMYGFNPYMVGVNPQMQQMQPPYMQMQQRPQQPQPQNTAVMYVSSAKDFANVTLQPPVNQAILVAQNDSYICFKKLENMMTKSFLFRLEPVTEEQINTPQVEYATKQEVATLENAIKRILNALGGQTDDKSIDASNDGAKPDVANDATTQKRQSASNF